MTSWMTPEWIFNYSWQILWNFFATVDGGWTEWSAWSSNCTCCDQNVNRCGGHHRSRSCDNPEPQNGGLPCNGSHVEEEYCDKGVLYWLKYKHKH